MRQGYSLGSSSSTARVQHESDIVGLRRLDGRGFTRKLSSLLHIQDDLTAIVVAFGDGGIVFPCCADSCRILRKCTLWYQSNC